MKPRSILYIIISLYVLAFAYLLYRSLSLEFNGELIALLPSDNGHLNAYEELTKLNNSEGGFDAILRVNEGQDVIAYAEKLSESVLALKLDGEDIFKNVELENDLYNIKYSALYLMTDAELDSTYAQVDDYIESKKLQANPIYVDFSDSEEEVDIKTESSVLLAQIADSERYRVNEDSTVIRMTFIPLFPKGDYDRTVSTYELLRQTSSALIEEYGFIDVYWGGSYINYYNKINDIQFTVAKALGIGTFSLLAFLVAYMFFINRNTGYRLKYIILDLLNIIFILFSGFTVSLGLASFFIDEINVFTGIIFSILVGINLDYILHVYSINKKTGIDISDIKSVLQAYLSSAKPIVLSALTTGLAIMSLIFADFEGFKHFGLIFFINVVVNLFATYVFLMLSPSVGSKRELSSEKKEDLRSLYNFLKDLPSQRRRWGLSVFLMIIMAGSYFGAQSLGFNFSFSDLEPQSERSKFDSLKSELNTGPGLHDPAFFVTETVDESRALFHYIRDNLNDTFTDIDRVESFSARYPASEEEFEAKSEKIVALQGLIKRNNRYLNKEKKKVNELVDVIKNTVRPDISNLPKYIKNRFFFKDDTIAPMVIIYSKMSLSNGATSIRFRNSSGIIEMDDNVHYATSTSMIASSILELLIKESTYLFVVPLLTIIGLLLAYYRSVVHMLIAITPLIITFLILLSLKNLFDFEINLYNVIVFPIIIGVGADNGIHLVDSLKNNRLSFLSHFTMQKLSVLSACSITTILGFIGLMFINYPGMESIGVLAITGIVITLLATVITSSVVETFLLKK